MRIASSSTRVLRRAVAQAVHRMLLKDGRESSTNDPINRHGIARRQTGVIAELLEKRQLLSSTYLSDLPWVSATNGWGPVERDMSNGGQGAGDGNTLTLNGVTYAKGLGVNSDSTIIYNLGGAYSTFKSDVGVDDEEATNGSVDFQVVADGTTLFDSGTMTPSTATKSINVSVAGVQQLELIVGDAGDGIDYDHGDWAGAELTGSPAAPSGLTAVASSPSEIDLSWTEQSTGASGFTVERSTDGTTFTPVATNLPASATSYNDMGLTGNTTYYYKVIATDDNAGDSPAATAQANTLAAAGSATYLSDLQWASATNGWGPVELDQSVGGQGADDGTTITLNGVTYAKGLGTNSVSQITYDLGGNYSHFLSDVGVDDHEQYDGSVVFQVFADGTKLFDSGTMVPSSATRHSI